MPNEYPVPVLGYMNKGFRLANSQIAKTQSGGIAVVIHLFYFEEYAFILSQQQILPPKLFCLAQARETGAFDIPLNFLQ